MQLVWSFTEGVDLLRTNCTCGNSMEYIYNKCMNIDDKLNSELNQCKLLFLFLFQINRLIATCITNKNELNISLQD